MTTKRNRANGEGSIFPYKNSYAAYVWVTKPDGKRTRKYVYGKDREDVHDKWIKLQAQAKAGPVVTNGRTLGDYLTYWLKEVVGPNLAPLTFSTRETFLRLYIVPGLGAKRLDKLQVRDVQTWVNSVARTCQCCAQGKDAKRRTELRRCCAVDSCCGELLSPRTIKDIRDTLRAALAHAMIEELITKNVAGLVKLPAPRRRKRKPWSSEEARRFLESAREDEDPLYAAYVLVLATGLRKGEVLGLTEDDADLDVAELSINFQLQRVGGELLHRQTKTEASDDTIPLPSICVTGLRLRAVRKAEDKERAGAAWYRSTLIFTTKLGTPIEPRNFNRAWDARCVRSGMRKITVHDARATCASLLVDLDVHPRVIMRILRHADFKVTMEIYSQASSRATREALKRLGERLDC